MTRNLKLVRGRREGSLNWKLCLNGTTKWTLLKAPEVLGGADDKPGNGVGEFDRRG